MKGRDHRVETLFHAVHEKPCAEWPALLAGANEDPEVVSAVRALLEADERAETWFAELTSRKEALQDELHGMPEADALAGRRIGVYELEREVGRGGTSVVYAARRVDGAFERTVAVKLLARRSGGADLRERFDREQRLLSGLAHPNIATIHDGGVTDDGYPYFVMELVEGLPLDSYCDHHRLSIDDRLRLFLTVADAVHHAHRNLVIHRDLKPSNILVTADGTVKLIDFGIARMVSVDSPEADAATTRLLSRWLTPEYSAPEQVRGEATTTATDVYQLGVVLYELLTGSHPVHVGARESAYLAGKAVCETEPERPSSVIGSSAAAAARRRTDLGRLRRQLRGDADAIVLKALQKEASERYGSAEGLARDIRRFLERKPVEAREGKAAYRFRKFVRRNRTAAATGAGIVLLMVAGGFFHTARLAEQRDLARLEAAKAQTVTEFLLDLFHASHPDESRGVPITAAVLLERGEERAERLSDQPRVKAEMLATIARAYHGLADFERSDRLYTRSLELRRSHLGPDHPDVAHSLAHLGWTRLSRGEFDTAAGLFREAADIQRRVLGSGHPDVANSLHGLALSLNGLGRVDEGVELLEQAQSVRRAAFGGGPHPETANGLNDLAILLRARGDREEAERVLREALAMRRAVLPPSHPDVGKSAQHLGSLLHEMGEYDRAEPLYLEALENWRSSLGPGHPSTLSTIRSLEALYREWKRPVDAVRYTAMLEESSP